MLRRLVYVGALVVLAALGDVAARGFVESKVNERAQQEAPPGSRISATVGGFPFLPPIILDTEVRSATVHIENLDAGPIVFTEVDVDLRGVRLDRSRLFNDRKARIKEIDHGKVTAILTAEALSRALPANPKVTMTGGQVTIGGVRAAATTRGGKLSIGGLTIPGSRYVPCISEVEVQEGRMVLSCEIDEVPAPLLDVVQD